MKIRIALALLVLAPLICTPLLAPAQEPSDSRKVITRVIPQYPALARSMNLKGIVKMLVCIAPDGSPKSIDVKGGNPVLAQSAEKALRNWKWEPSTHATCEAVDLRFDAK